MKSPFTRYQKSVVAILAFLQFTIILDFMVLSPLGAMLMPALRISPAQFSLVVSVYAFSAGISGFLAAGFADRFDRKKFLLFFYSGFIVATFFCGIAPDYKTLMAARVMTGIFGGVIGSIIFAIATDLFAMEVRGRVMGVIQTSFAASQVLGLPVGLYLANHFGWHAPFMMIVGAGAAGGFAIARVLRPVDAHLKLKSTANPLLHLIRTVSKPRYIQGFVTAALLMVGGFMLMPFGSAFSVHNLGIGFDKLPLMYFITGVSAIFFGPLIGRLTDRVGAYLVFFSGSLIMIATALYYTQLGVTPFVTVAVISVLMFGGVSARMISSSALMSGIAKPADRGAYMAVSASIQQISGGFASALAGAIVVEGENGYLMHYERLGYAVSAAALFTIVMMYFIHRYLKARHVVSEPIQVTI